MNLKLKAPQQASIGQTIDLEASVAIEGELDHDIAFVGLQLNAIRPCDRPLLIDQREIFCKGAFKPATYTRRVAIALSPRIVPSSQRRGITYTLDLFSRLAGEKNQAGQEMNEKREIRLLAEATSNKGVDVNPVVLAIKGMKLSLQKDVYRPGETIKIDYEITGADLRQLKVVIMQRSNITCKCTQYGRVCTKVPDIPPSPAGAVKSNNPTTGFMLLKVPAEAEVSARHEWEPREKTTWSDKFGDYNEWYLHVIGAKMNGALVEFEIPLEVDDAIPKTEKRDKDIDFFEMDSSTLDSAKQTPILVPRKISISQLKVHDHEIEMMMAIDGHDLLQGCTCKITGLKGFFETPPFMAGLGDIKAGKETSVKFPKPSGVQEYTLEFSSNKGPLGSLRKIID